MSTVKSIRADTRFISLPFLSSGTTGRIGTTHPERVSGDDGAGAGAGVGDAVPLAPTPASNATATKKSIGKGRMVCASGGRQNQELKPQQMNFERNF